MKRTNELTRLALGLWALGFGLQTVHADLTAEVLPGYTFGTSERPTTSTLNRLGLPTIRITGTVGGTNAGITAGSITTTMLSDNVVDGTTIYFNGSREFAVIPYSVGTNSLSNNICGFGLTGGNGAQLSVTYDTNFFAVGATNINSGTNGLTLLSSLWGVISNTVWLQTNVFTSTNITLTSSMAVSIPHLLGPLVTNSAAPSSFTNAPLQWTPRFVHWVFYCTGVEDAYALGDEVPVSNVVSYDNAGSDVRHAPAFATGVNTTNVFIVKESGVTDLRINQKDGAPLGVFNLANWKARCYVRP